MSAVDFSPSAMPEPGWTKPRDRSASQSTESKSVIGALKKTAFVIGTALIVFAAARNSITWHFENFWGASGNFWQNQWGNVHYLFAGDDMALTIIGTNLVTFGFFWLFSALYLFVDITGRPKWALKYKIQDGQNVPLDMVKFTRAIKQVLFNQVVVGIPFSVLVAPLLSWRGCSFGPELPWFHWVLFEIAIFTLVEEVAFYYSHRLLHHPKIYKYIHKRHHEWTAPIGMIAIYAHPIEHLMSNVIPVMSGPFLMGSHIATAWMWFALALMTTINTHSGYHFPLMPSPEAHDFHHLKFNQNYGVLGVLDRLHGTDLQFRASQAYERHIMLLGLEPLTVTFPDNTKGCGKKCE